MTLEQLMANAAKHQADFEAEQERLQAEHSAAIQKTIEDSRQAGREQLAKFQSNINTISDRVANMKF